jgi:hypothetical protein
LSFSVSYRARIAGPQTDSRYLEMWDRLNEGLCKTGMLNVDTRRRLERLERANTGHSPTDQLRLWPRLRNCATAGSSKTRFRRGLRVSSPTIA